MYPDRRPYATAVPHRGYCAKPIAPRPPADALAMLRSHVGYDDLRRNGREDDDAKFTASSMRTLAGRTYPPPTATSATVHTVDTQRLLPSTDRSVEEALAAAELQPPIEHDALTYHGCQQAALNAELRDKTEAHGAARSARIAAVRELLASLPAESAVLGNNEVESLQKYLTAYRCTEEMTVPETELLPPEEAPLCTPMAEVDSMTQLPPVPSDAMRRALDDMLSSQYLLAPLENYLARLSLLDKLSAMKWRGEEGAVGGAVVTTTPASVESTSKGATQTEETVLCPSRAAVALHERLHFNPGDYSERELKKSEEALLELQQRVQAAKQQKEDAIDANDPVTALRNLHAQVDFSNDLLLLYKARMAQVEMHTDDVQDFRCDVVALIDDARRAAEAVLVYAQRALPTIQHDVSATARAISASDKALDEAQATEKAAEVQMREQLTTMDGESRALWKEVLALMEKISEKAQERGHYVQQCMSRREQRAKVVAKVEATRKAQEAHAERLRQCEEVLTRWEGIGSVYTKYVEACAPKLLQHLAAVEDAHDDLTQREAEGYVSVFEQFVYAAEEARAKRRTQAERMRLLQRSTQLNQARADETLDPDAASHAQRLADATQELEEVQLYLKYVNDMEADRRAEVDPVLMRVLVRHAQSHVEDDNTAESPPAQELLENGGSAPSTAAAVAAKEAGAALDTEPTRNSPAKERETPSSAVVAAAATSTSDRSDAPVSNNGGVMVATEPADAAAPANMTHPFVAARQIGFAHEEKYLRKHEQLTERELLELEGKQTGLRHSREELRAMEAKYRNADAIRALLGLS
ncbi:hypothetical protein ABB37_09342 [Leptomonas pyrrhocoris]|uniref:Paraflagellar rod protein n=1 Tax=Leptomonas pyrrhocoris TaxID=157538 RepID=A0A0M9FR51_LEPPY|nr:hypothetical protein ABB37_09342 [Leptomonas pyrrhocoris]XP_015652803.1 hypothetical protein ABB37_09342 [Leptomonas pyrrhocoris]XP_015652804.1 hypothetical protein ABB37_09342 [Leptomonas pyrrhocoris]KPA74363.1 hypothetical protein ABB37_09342 [Leptomonas pyrrhocoris]KPA74364.1 hypothetical protein ABB37_09342 [Leptomonas pyrrhocoris]KPA74365.1 hypothetical protein ABB37_09342 [Leptomonas pyrrhocoris]|eukprot:XP_015652802.1 hypothetical protein ABB37_09342 [Leptomonas pyrrhocoris]